MKFLQLNTKLLMVNILVFSGLYSGFNIFLTMKQTKLGFFYVLHAFFFTSNVFFQLRLIFSLTELHMLLRCCLIHLLIHVVYLVYLCSYLDLCLFMSYLYYLFFIFIVIIFSVIIITHITSLQQTPIRAWCCL